MHSRFTLSVNDEEHVVTCEPDTPLLYVLRNDLNLLGTKFGCGLGLCGACNVLMDGVAVHSCDTPVWGVLDKRIRTIEALGSAQDPSVLARAFLHRQAAQCGFCLSGILVTATALLDAQPLADETTIRAALDGNLCRCGSHNRIVDAVLDAESELAQEIPNGSPT